MGRAGKSLLRSSGLRAAVDDLGRGQKLRAAAGQRAALAGALAENLLTRRSHAHVRRLVHEPMSHQRSSSLAANLLRTTQIATGRIVPLTGLLSLLDLVVVAEVEPLQTSARITHLEIGRVAIVSRCDVVGDVAELSVVGSVAGTAQFGLPLERCLRH